MTMLFFVVVDVHVQLVVEVDDFVFYVLWREQEATSNCIIQLLFGS
jgi:hypothetical protein